MGLLLMNEKERLRKATLEMVKQGRKQGASIKLTLVELFRILPSHIKEIQ